MPSFSCWNLNLTNNFVKTPCHLKIIFVVSTEKFISRKLTFALFLWKGRDKSCSLLENRHVMSIPSFHTSKHSFPRFTPHVLHFFIPYQHLAISWDLKPPWHRRKARWFVSCNDNSWQTLFIAEVGARLSRQFDFGAGSQGEAPLAASSLSTGGQARPWPCKASQGLLD